MDSTKMYTGPKLLSGAGLWEMAKTWPSEVHSFENTTQRVNPITDIQIHGNTEQIPAQKNQGSLTTEIF